MTSETALQATLTHRLRRHNKRFERHFERPMAAGHRLYILVIFLERAGRLKIDAGCG